MKSLIHFVKFFLYITTGILFVCAVNLELAGADALPCDTLWQILLSGLLTTGITLLLFSGNKTAKGSYPARILIHYAALCLVMIFFGCHFGWINLNFRGILIMLVSVAVVYLITFFSYYLTDIKQAREINRKLTEKYGEEKNSQSNAF